MVTKHERAIQTAYKQVNGLKLFNRELVFDSVRDYEFKQVIINYGKYKNNFRQKNSKNKKSS